MRRTRHVRHRRGGRGRIQQRVPGGQRRPAYERVRRVASVVGDVRLRHHGLRDHRVRTLEDGQRVVVREDAERRRALLHGHGHRDGAVHRHRHRPVLDLDVLRSHRAVVRRQLWRRRRHCAILRRHSGVLHAHPAPGCRPAGIAGVHHRQVPLVAGHRHRQRRVRQPRIHGTVHLRAPLLSEPRSVCHVDRVRLNAGLGPRLHPSLSLGCSLCKHTGEAADEHQGSQPSHFLSCL
mmetsp:Transcript_21975/g.70734  ORF Transcript_21975/g.70734 Transcript_21975/m.70734 type:complete len:235 (-) Transcript_21975:1-705(-)